MEPEEIRPFCISLFNKFQKDEISLDEMNLELAYLTINFLDLYRYEPIKRSRIENKSNYNWLRECYGFIQKAGDTENLEKLKAVINDYAKYGN